LRSKGEREKSLDIEGEVLARVTLDERSKIESQEFCWTRVLERAKEQSNWAVRMASFKCGGPVIAPPKGSRAFRDPLAEFWEGVSWCIRLLLCGEGWYV
jgi:hypothetical protein